MIRLYIDEKEWEVTKSSQDFVALRRQKKEEKVNIEAIWKTEKPNFIHILYAGWHEIIEKNVIEDLKKISRDSLILL